VGKARPTGQARTDGRRPHRTLRPATVGAAPQQPTARQGRANPAKTHTPPRFRALYGGLEAALVLAGWRDRNQQAASGVDGLTAHASEATRQANRTAWGPRLKTPRSRAPRVRRGSRPQAHGPDRP
jgi:hypothetical protein